jgi:hypothetical protein
VEGEGGNREVPPLLILGRRADLEASGVDFSRVDRSSQTDARQSPRALSAGAASGAFGGASVEAYIHEEGGSRGKHGFPRGSDPKGSDAA